MEYSLSSVAVQFGNPLQRFSFGCDLITTVSEPTPNVVRAESRQGFGEGGLEEGLSPSGAASQKGFQLGPARLDGREVW